MANGTYLRGEVYWVRADDTIGSEEGIGRPAVIISSNHGNENNGTVVVAFLSTQSNPLPINPSVEIAGRKQRVLCNQIRTISKTRLEKQLGTLTESEMIRVTGALGVALCIGTPPKNKDVETSEVESLKMQATMYQKLYEKTMDQLVEIKIANDLNRKMSEPKVAEKKEEPAPPSAPELENVRVEINTCSVEDLMKCGCSVALARLIISYRPYKTVGDLTRVPGLKSTAFQILKHKVCCTWNEETTKPKMIAPPVATVKKANVNTATATELHEISGMALSDAYGITAYRKKIGVYKSLEDLLQAPRYTERKLQKHRSKLEV